MRVRYTVIISIFVLFIVFQSSAFAGWTKVSDVSVNNFTSMGLARTADGTLHAVYVGRDRSVEGASTNNMQHVELAANGKQWVLSEVFAGDWSSGSDPALISSQNNLYLFFGGSNSKVNIDVEGWFSTLNNGNFGAGIKPLSYTKTFSSNGFAAAADKNGMPWVAWPILEGSITSGPTKFVIHAGATGVDDTEVKFNTGMPMRSESLNMGRDLKTGKMYSFWSSATEGTRGYYAWDVSSAGSKITKFAMKRGSTNSSVGTIFWRMPVASRTRGGVFTAYCYNDPCDSIRIVGTNKKSLIYAGPKNAYVNNLVKALVAAPNGRLWLVWVESRFPQGAHIFAARTNSNVTKLGAPIDLGIPSKNESVYGLIGDASTGALDVITNAQTNNVNYLYYRRVSPKLSLQKTSVRFSRSKLIITLKVTDAGEPVRAMVRVGKRKVRANRKGIVKILVPYSSKRSVSVTASASGYFSAKTRVRLR